MKSYQGFFRPTHNRLHNISGAMMTGKMKQVVFCSFFWDANSILRAVGHCASHAERSLHFLLKIVHKSFLAPHTCHFIEFLFSPSAVTEQTVDVFDSFGISEIHTNAEPH